MKRIIPAAIILILIIFLCYCSNLFINQACNSTVKDIHSFKNNAISSQELQSTWHKRKENMSIFVNHELLDDITLYVEQLIIHHGKNDDNFDYTAKNIETFLSIIKDEQRLTIENFY